MSVYVFGDLHGEITRLKEMIDKIEYNELEDKLIFLGDYVDRGENSKKTVNYIRNYLDNGRNIFIRGNHEELMIKAVENNEYMLWEYNGGYKTRRDFNNNQEKMREVVEWFKSLSVIYITDNNIFVHAGINLEKDLYNQDKDYMLWVRDEFININWNEYDFEKTIFVGHTPFEDVWSNGKTIFMDTGAGKGGYLSCFEIETGEVYKV